MTPTDPASAGNNQAAFEKWLARTCPSGDAESVHLQWLASTDYADLLEAQPPRSGEGDQFKFECMACGTKTNATRCMDVFCNGSTRPIAPATPEGSSPKDPAWVTMRQKLDELLENELADTYVCGRVWSAWSVGTMGEDDFTRYPETDRIENLVYEIEEIVEDRIKVALTAAQAEIARLSHVNHFWTVEYGKMDRDHLIGECVARAVCREADFAKVEELEAEIGRLRGAMEVIAAGVIKKEFAGGAVSAPMATREYMMRLAENALAAAPDHGKEGTDV